jgi:ketopantoate reductase
LHVDAINAHGLLLDTQSFRGHLPAKAATDAASVTSPDLVLFCVKSADIEEAGRSLAACLRPETSVLSLQQVARMSACDMRDEHENKTRMSLSLIRATLAPRRCI